MRLMLVEKNNIGMAHGGKAYKVAIQEHAATGDGVPVLEWQPGNVDMTANDAMSAVAENADPALSSAVDFLQDYLANTAREAKDVCDAARNAGVSERTLHRARTNSTFVAFVKALARLDGSCGLWLLKRTFLTTHCPS